MTPLGTIARLGGAALIIFAFVAPLAWCQAQYDRDATALQLACIQAKREWIRGYCDLAKEEATK